MSQVLTNGNDRVTGSNLTSADVYALDGDDSIIFTGSSLNNPISFDLDIYGGIGRDFLGAQAGFGFQVQAYGDSGQDTLYGAENDDDLWGGQSSDLLIGGNYALVQIEGGVFANQAGSFATGNDSLFGGTERDALYGLDGDDFLYGGPGNDGGGFGSFRVSGSATNLFQNVLLGLFGGDGNDYIDGGQGDDYLDGGNGNDTIFANQGNDRVFGGAGNDIVWGGYEMVSMVVNGNAGNDYVIGNSGGDSISGDEDDDIIFGRGSFDFLQGGSGNDQLYSGGGSDYMLGGEGFDAFSFFESIFVNEVDVIGDFTAGQDFLVFPTYTAGDIFFAQFGADAYAYIAVGGGFWALNIQNTTVAQAESAVFYF